MNTTTTKLGHLDDRGRELRVGDRVIKTAIDTGAPAYAHRGTVVGFGRTRTLIEWDEVGYKADGDPRFYFLKPHSVHGSNVRVTDPAPAACATCGDPLDRPSGAGNSVSCAGDHAHGRCSVSVCWDGDARSCLVERVSEAGA